MVNIATIHGQVTTDYWTFKLEVTEGAQNITNNTSSVTVDVYIGRVSDVVGSYIYGANINCTVGCTGVTSQSFNFYNSTQINIGSGEYYKIGSVTFSAVPHNDDGSKTVTISASFTNTIKPSSGSASGTVTLSTIARASQPSLKNPYPNTVNNIGSFGNTITIYTNRKSSSFTHTVRYEFGSESKKCVDAKTGKEATSVGDSFTWTIPNSLMNLLPSSTSGSGRIYVDTYSGSKLIGTKYTGFTATVPSSVKPSVTFTLTDVVSGVGDVYNKPVKGLSKIKIEANPTLAYSSPIVSYTIKANGATYNTSTATTGVLLNSGDSIVTVTVTDKRGRTGSKSYTMDVLDYSPPSITALSVRRYDSTGTANNIGEYIKATFSARSTDLVDKNQPKYLFSYKKTTDSTWTDVDITELLSNPYKVDSYITNPFSALVDYSYNVKITVSDNHNTVSRTTSVSTGFTLMNFGASGTSIGLGKVSEHTNTLDIGLKVKYVDPDQARNAVGTGNGLTTVTEKAPNDDPNLITKTGFYSAQNRANLGDGNVDHGRSHIAHIEGMSNYAMQFRFDYNEDIITTRRKHAGEWQGWKSLATLDQIYPVGSIYLAYNHTSPASLFGGTWTRIENRFLWATTETGTIGHSSGQGSVTLSIVHLPGVVWSCGGQTGGYNLKINASGSAYTFQTQGTNMGLAHDNMPPYIQISAWRRTA